MKKPLPDRLTVLDLFSGPGGLSHGIEMARNRDSRFEVIVANDSDPDVGATFQKNHPHTRFVSGSITKEETKERILRAIRSDRHRPTVDLVIGGPPCRGFSVANKMTRNMKNPLNHLVLDFVEMIKITKPAAFVMENVPGIFAMQSGGMVETLISEFRSFGYHNARPWLLNAADYGVPQMRKRAFLVGSRSTIPLEEPRVTHASREDAKRDHRLKEYSTVGSAIEDLPDIPAGMASANSDEYKHPPENNFQAEMRFKSTRVRNHVVTRNTDIVIERIKSVPPGGNWRDIPIQLMRVNGKYGNIEKAHSMIYKRLLSDEPSITITNFRKGMIVHPSQDRLLSVREAARIQTFPDNFEFIGGLGKQQQQVADAVPVNLARRVGDTMLSHLHEVIRLPIH